MSVKPFRFGVVVRERPTRREWVERVRRLEGLGYATLLMPDHFSEQLAPGPALALAAEVTSRLRIASHVYDNDFRHPALLAKEAATLDRLSEGRFEFGIGAGWLKSEYEQIDIPFDAPGVRVDRLAEAVEVIKGLWSDGPFAYQGWHYTIRDYEGLPKPLQQPRPPLFLGGGGRRLLSLAAREADIVGLGPKALREGGLDARDVTVEAVARKVEWVRAAAGERAAEIELSTLIYDVSITDRRRARIEAMLDEWDLSAEEIGASPYLFVGSVDQIADDLRARREQFGISYITLFDADADNLAPVVARLSGT